MLSVNAMIETVGTLALLILAGVTIGLIDRRNVSFGWLLAAAALLAVNDALLTRGFGLLPNFLPASHWNWQGKIFALVATLMVASLPGFGWRQAGLTLVQAKGSLGSCLVVALLYGLFFVTIALIFPDDGQFSLETLAFQLTMPGIEEEAFYRGVLLLALDRAFTARVTLLGVEWGWGAVLSCALFGLDHALSFSHGHFDFEPLIMALTALPSFIAVWLRLRSGSVLIPVLLHNFGNSIPLIV